MGMPLISPDGLEFTSKGSRWLLRTGSSWINTLFGIVLVCVVGYVAIEHGDLFRASPTLPRQAANTGQQGMDARKGRAVKKTGVTGGSDVALAEQPVKDGDAGAAPFSVFSGTDGQTAAAESMCSRARETRGEGFSGLREGAVGCDGESDECS